MPLDLDAYLQRIGYAGPREPSLATLKAVHQLHPRAIAFDSLDPWLGRPVKLDLNSLEAKLVTARRGGYCYEHNTLFWAALSALGFAVSGLSARVLYSTPPGGGRHPRNHMLMLVDLAEGQHIADVGFGGLTLTAPLRLQAGSEQTTPHERVRLTQARNDFVLEVLTDTGAPDGGTWRPLYQFGLEDNIAPDYEMANWYMSTHPRSPFTPNLVAARALPGRRLALSNRQFTIHQQGAPSEKRNLADSSELRRVLVEAFGITLPDDPALGQRLGELVV